MTGHDKVHYAIHGVLVAALIGMGTGFLSRLNASDGRIARAVARPMQGVTAPVPRNAWPALGQDKTIALGDAITGKVKGPINIWCADLGCAALSADLDDAFQIADVAGDQEGDRVDSNDETGIGVGPPGEDAIKLAGALQQVLGPAAVHIVDAPQGALSVIIGRRPK